MNAWVEQQLAGEESAEKPAQEGEEGYVDPRNALYDVNELAPEFKDAVAPNKDRSSEEATWLTGITEVQLPIEYKMKNIEATEVRAENSGEDFFLL